MVNGCKYGPSDWGLIVLLATVSNLTVARAELTVVSVQPAARSLDAPVDEPISVTFDRPVSRNSVTDRTFWAFGRWSGPLSGAYSFSNGDQTVTLTPDHLLSAGETVTVVLAHHLRATDGFVLRAGGYSYQFWTRTQPAPMNFAQIDVLSTRTQPLVSTRAYGGIATDLNRDGWLDLTIVNEDTADLRVFMNLADGTGLFADFLQPTFPVGARASPSEPSDFNRDGQVDICVANINDNSVSILLGNGDGTFAAQQVIPVGAAPRGIAVLDADGDGDMDVVNTNFADSNLSILLNNGLGVFGAPTYFEGGGAGEWALAAADLNEDGMLDLVIGARSSASIVVNTANGDGTFSFASTQSAGGAVWMLNVGDLNGDGHEDVATANSSPANNGAILFGDGTGNLAPPTTVLTDAFPLATDLGDLDGDGDLDWVTSSFLGDWFLFTNDGQGAFAFHQEFLAPQAASCALLFDMDNDGDLDLGLIDELEDVVILMKNSGTSPPGDGDGDGDVDLIDYASFAECLAGPNVPTPPPGCTAQRFDAFDLTGDDDVDLADAAAFWIGFTG
ncbi:MAG: VCBS repeat-containing protein [Planctomycetes bacterium]|nr:VCBS repeat-containing protein [Planctomycetota bacterium]